MLFLLSLPNGDQSKNSYVLGAEDITDNCSKDDDCAENEKCKGGKCAPMTSPECKSNSDCSNGKKCMNGKCINKNGQTGTIPEVVAGVSELSVLLNLVKGSGLLATLKDKGPFTVFAPINKAFESIPKSYFGISNNELEKKERIKIILLRHVIKGSKINGDGIKDGETKSIKSAGGKMITIKKENSVIHIYPGGAEVIKADIQASNGVIHVIDKLIIVPPGGNCSKDDDCNVNEKCQGEKCAPTTGPECKSDSDCSDGKKCMIGKCIKQGI